MTKKTIKEQELNKITGVGDAMITKLGEAGKYTILSVAVLTVRELIGLTGMGDMTARKIINEAKKLCGDDGFEIATKTEERRTQIEHIPLGADAFDEMIGGGFETGCITETHGKYGSSKTQIAHQLCVNVQKMNPKYMVAYIDSENSFRPNRIRQFAKGAGLDEDAVLKNILYKKARNSDEQTFFTEKIEELINKGHNIKLVVIDSLTAHFRAEYPGRGVLAERQQRLNTHMNTLAKLADIYNLCVYVTNQVMAKPGQSFGDPTEAIGGYIVSHAAKVRIYLRHATKGSRVAKLIDSPDMPDSEAPFMVHEGKITDIDAK